MTNVLGTIGLILGIIVSCITISQVLFRKRPADPETSRRSSHPETGWWEIPDLVVDKSGRMTKAPDHAQFEEERAFLEKIVNDTEPGLKTAATIAWTIACLLPLGVVIGLIFGLIFLLHVPLIASMGLGLPSGAIVFAITFAIARKWLSGFRAEEYDWEEIYAYYGMKMSDHFKTVRDSFSGKLSR